jgi:hypothetical protein
MNAANIAATLGDAARDAAAGWFTEGRRVRIALPPAPNTDFNDNKARDYVAGARITAASAWIGNGGRIAATADRLDNAAELCCSRPSLGHAFLDSAPV